MTKLTSPAVFAILQAAATELKALGLHASFMPEYIGSEQQTAIAFRVTATEAKRDEHAAASIYLNEHLMTPAGAAALEATLRNMRFHLDGVEAIKTAGGDREMLQRLLATKPDDDSSH